MCSGPAKPREGPVCILSRPGAPRRRPVALSCSPQGRAIWSGRQTLARGKGLWPWVPRPRREGLAWLLLGSGLAATAAGHWARWPPTRQAEKWGLTGCSLRLKTRAHRSTFSGDTDRTHGLQVLSPHGGAWRDPGDADPAHPWWPSLWDPGCTDSSVCVSMAFYTLSLGGWVL